MAENLNMESKAKYKVSFSDFLNIAAAGILIFIICVLLLICFKFSFASSSLNSETIKPEIAEIRINNLDSTSLLINKPFIDTLNLKIKDFNSKIEALDNVKQEITQQQEKNENFYKLFLALISTVFAIVGFFGFKSIYDTRQLAVDKAISEAKKEAIIVAKSEAEKEAKKEANTVAGITAKKIAEETAKVSTTEYLNDNLEKHTKEIEKTVTVGLEARITSIENDINKYLNPKNYNESERPQIFNQINEAFDELNRQIKEMEEKVEQLKNDSFKKIIINEILEQTKIKA